MTLTTEALTLVTTRPRPYWGERWEVMARCLKRYEPGRPLAHYFNSAERRARLDRQKYARAKIRQTVPYVDCMNVRPAPCDPPDLGVLDLVTSRERAMLELVARGNDYRGVAAGMGCSVSAYFQTMRRMRARLACHACTGVQ